MSKKNIVREVRETNFSADAVSPAGNSFGIDGATITPTLDVAEIGKRLKTMRLAKGLTLAELAEKTGCSASLVSRTENGHSQPSLSVLQKLVTGLGTGMASFLSVSETESCVVIRASERQEVVTKHTEWLLKGVRIEQIIPHSPGGLLEGNLLTIAAGTESSDEFTHAGEEAGYIIKGFINLTIAKQTYILGAGDSFCFLSESPHSFANPGREDAIVIWIHTPPTF